MPPPILNLFCDSRTAKAMWYYLVFFLCFSVVLVVLPVSFTIKFFWRGFWGCDKFKSISCLRQFIGNVRITHHSAASQADTLAHCSCKVCQPVNLWGWVLSSIFWVNHREVLHRFIRANTTAEVFSPISCYFVVCRLELSRWMDKMSSNNSSDITGELRLWSELK